MDWFEWAKRQEKTCFILRDWDVAPHTTIQYGQIIVDASEPTQPLADSPLKFTEYEKTFDNPVQKDREYVVEDSWSIGASLLVAFLSFVTVGIYGALVEGYHKIYKIDLIHTKTLEPSQPYVLDTVMQSSVLSYLHKHKYKKSLYMVVGLKIGEGAKIILSEGKGTVVGGRAGLLLLAGRLPVGIEASFSCDYTRVINDSFLISSLFVFAYRLKKCHYYPAGSTII
jgi:hypothetical protein